MDDIWTSVFPEGPYIQPEVNNCLVACSYLDRTECLCPHAVAWWWNGPTSDYFVIRCTIVVSGVVSKANESNSAFVYLLGTETEGFPNADGNHVTH